MPGVQHLVRALTVLLGLHQLLLLCCLMQILHFEHCWPETITTEGEYLADAVWVDWSQLEIQQEVSKNVDALLILRRHFHPVLNGRDLH